MGICYQSLRQRQIIEVSEHGGNMISTLRGKRIRDILERGDQNPGDCWRSPCISRGMEETWRRTVVMERRGGEVVREISKVVLVND